MSPGFWRRTAQQPDSRGAGHSDAGASTSGTIFLVVPLRACRSALGGHGKMHAKTSPIPGSGFARYIARRCHDLDLGRLPRPGIGDFFFVFFSSISFDRVISIFRAINTALSACLSPPNLQPSLTSHLPSDIQPYQRRDASPHLVQPHRPKTPQNLSSRNVGIIYRDKIDTPRRASPYSQKRLTPAVTHPRYYAASDEPLTRCRLSEPAPPNSVTLSGC